MEDVALPRLASSFGLTVILQYRGVMTFSQWAMLLDIRRSGERKGTVRVQ
jgi:hypothetical protein